MMLDSVLFYKKAFIHMKASDANFVHCPNFDEWNRIEKICKFLSVFHDVTQAFSGTKYPTATLYFPNVLKVRLLLKEHMESSDKFLKTMAIKMWEKFEKYWSKFSPIMAIAVVFDPRYKLQFVEWAYKKVYEVTATSELEDFKRKLFALYDEYAASVPVPSPAATAQRGNVRAATVEQPSDTFMEDFDEYDSIMSPSAEKSELLLYLDEKKLPRTAEINVLEHWKRLQGRFPTLARMDRDILAIPISTVASESAFSIGGRVLDVYRSSLNPSTAEALICPRDWVFQKDPLEFDIEQLCNQVVGMNVEDDDVAADPCSSNHQSEAS